MSIIIEKNGKKVLELCRMYEGSGVFLHAIKRNGYYSIISAEKFASILDRADEGGYNIFDYVF